MLITTALHHDEYAFKGIVAVPEDVVPEDSSDQTHRGARAPEYSDVVAQSADVA